MLILFFIGCLNSLPIICTRYFAYYTWILLPILKKIYGQKTEMGRINQFTLKIVSFFYFIFQLKTLLIGLFRY